MKRKKYYDSGMKRNSTGALANLARRITPLALTSILIATTAYAQAAAKESKEAKQEKEHPVTSLKIVVTGGDKDVPISNASVYVRYEQPRFLLPAEKIELDLKTDLEGIAKVKDVPRMRIMIQVVKGGWRPFGEYFELTKDEQTIQIKMLPPAHWY